MKKSPAALFRVIAAAADCGLKEAAQDALDAIHKNPDIFDAIYKVAEDQGVEEEVKEAEERAEVALL